MNVWHKLFSQYKQYILIGVIILFAIFVRTYHLISVPYSIHRDEVANTYLGRFVLENGVDIYGNRWPLFYIDKFGDFPPAIPMYLSGAVSYITGVNVYASRLPAALAGTLFIVGLYLFILQTFNQQTALLASFLAAILPWHVNLSRAGSEGIIALTVWILGIYLLVCFLKNKHSWQLVLSVFLLFLTYFLYPSFRLLTPLSLDSHGRVP